MKPGKHWGFNKLHGSSKGGNPTGFRKQARLARVNTIEADQAIIAGDRVLSQFYSTALAGLNLGSRDKIRETLVLVIEQTKRFAEQQKIPWELKK